MINYRTGDATSPDPDLNSFNAIIHICNDMDKWGSGFVVKLGKKFPEVKEAYHHWFTLELVKEKAFTESNYIASGHADIGEIQIVPTVICKNIDFICNMIAQEGLIGKENPHPLKYDKLESCLNKFEETRKTAEDKTGKPIATHMPRIGCGLAGGSWEEVESLINKTLNGNIYVYDLPT